MAEYHPYQKYSVAPGLFKFGADFGNGEADQQYFQIDDQFDEYIHQKRLSLARQPVYVDHSLDPAVERTICEFIQQQDSRSLPGNFKDIGLFFQEDLAIVQGDCLVACNVAFPSGWNPAHEVGKTFREVHASVAGMNLDNAELLAQSMIHRGPYVRFVWGLGFENRLNNFPDLPRAEFSLETICMKVERQITKGFPEVDAALFIIRQYRYPLDQIKIPLLISGIEGMSEEHLAFKGIDECKENLLNFLKGKEAS